MATTIGGLLDIQAQTSNPDKRFQVLALDGGGLCGLFPAAILAHLEEDLGDRVVDRFDLITGTSTGGVIALGLGLGVEPTRIVELYAEEGARIFANPARIRSLLHPFRPKYGAKRIEEAFQEIFGTARLADSHVPLVIPAYNLGDDNVYLFKTPHHPRLRRDARVPAWEVARATSAAPTFLRPHRLERDRVHLIDGGVWANNPVMVGITEAVSMFGAALEDITVLSLGTTTPVRKRWRGLSNGGVVHWAWGNHAFDVILRGQSIGAHAQARHLLGDDRIIRVDPVVPHGLLRLDRIDIDELMGKASAHSRELAPKYRARFADHVPQFDWPTRAEEEHPCR